MRKLPATLALCSTISLAFLIGCEETKEEQKERIERGSQLSAMRVQNHFINLYKRWAPATVAVYDAAGNKFMGSGFFMNEAGFLLTAEHVVRGRKQVQVVQSTSGRRWTAEVVQTDFGSDLALLQAKFDGATPKGIPFIAITGPNHAFEGNLYVAIGSPYGFEATLSTGVIGFSRRVNADRSRAALKHVQLSHQVLPGSSGGPVLDMEGKLVGMMRFNYSPAGRGAVGLGFAVPARKVDEFVQQQKRIRDMQISVQRGIVPIPFVTPFLMKKLRLPGSQGALVSYTIPDSPAARAGIKRYDFIIEVGGEPVNSSPKLRQVLTQRIEVEEVPVKLWREGKELTLTIKGKLDPEKIKDVRPKDGPGILPGKLPGVP